MIRKYYITLIFLLSFGLCGIIGVQAYWLYHAYRMETEAFEEKVITALNESAVSLSWYEQEVIKYDTSLLNGIRKNIAAIKDQQEPYEVKNVSVQRIDSSLISRLYGTLNAEDVIIFSADSNLILSSDISSKLMLASNAFKYRVGEDLLALRKKVVEKYMQRAFEHARVKRHIDSQYVGFVTYGDEVIAEINMPREGLPQVTSMVKSGTDIQYAQYLFDTEEEPGKWLFHLVVPSKVKLYPAKVISMLGLSLLFTGIIIVIFIASLRMVIKSQKLTDMRTEMITNLTHELKTPISTIYIAANQISTAQGSMDKISAFSEIIKEEDKRILKHVEAVLDLSRSEGGFDELKKESIHVSSLLKGIVENAEIQVTERKGTLSFTDQASGQQIMVDKEKMTIALQNIIDNGIKYCRAIPHIRIHSYLEQSHVSISIADNGIGIAGSDLKRIFDKFYRISSGDQHNVKGYGIGLTFAKNIVEHHGGIIEVRSVPNEGSEFVIKLPV